MNARRILLVDDDDDFRGQMRRALARMYRLEEAASIAEFRLKFRPYTFGLVILDMRLETAKEGLELLREIYENDELQPVIMVSAYGDTESILDAVQAGALMFLDKQEFSPGLLARMVEAVLQQGRIRRHLAALESRFREESRGELMGTAAVMGEVRRLVRRTAEEPEAVIVVTGEQGSGREAVARTIHAQSQARREGPFVLAASAPAGTETWEAHVWGEPPQPGTVRRKGLLESAFSGVLFLEDLTGIPESLLKGILEATVTGQSTIPGSTWTVPVDIQLILGSQAAAPELLAARSTITANSPQTRLIEIALPPLRERRQDIALLSTHFQQRQRTDGHTSARTISAEAVELLERYPWPGNVRELRSAIEYAGLQAAATDQDLVRVEHLPQGLQRAPEAAERWDYRYHLARAEVALVERALKERQITVKTQLARALGYNDRYTLRRRVLKQFESYPGLAREYSAAAELFSVATQA